MKYQEWYTMKVVSKPEPVLLEQAFNLLSEVNKMAEDHPEVVGMMVDAKNSIFGKVFRFLYRGE